MSKKGDNLMGTKARDAVKAAGIKVPELVKLLNKAFADEWLAYYQYWLGAQLAAGVPKGEVIEELKEHAEEELKHANMLAKRIIELGGIPVLEPKLWYEEANCRYLPPKDPDIHTLLDQNIRGEQCAISVYYKLLEFVKDKDPITFDLIRKILEEELEHEHDLEDLKHDLELSKAYKKRS
jgi:bacterioferritin